MAGGKIDPSEWRVTLVTPPMNFYKELYGFRTRTSFRNQIPLGMGYVAAYLRENGFPVTLVDSTAHGWDVQTTVDRVLQTEPSIIGITAITMEAPSAFSLIGALKERTSVPVVLGGAHANSYYKEIPEQCPELDVIVVGDGELTMLDLCRRLAEDGTPEGIAGLRYRLRDGSFSRFVERPLVEDLDSLPFPAYDMYEHGLYVALPHRRKRLPVTSMITSRGCSYARCTYCEMGHLVRKKYRRNSPERVVLEMKELLRLSGAREVYFQDDIFVTDRSWMESFCGLMIREDMDVIWSCESRFDILDDDLLRLMKRAGCWRMYYGFEAGDQSLLDRIRKGFTLDEAREAAARARNAGLEVVGFFMLGLPGETPELARKTIRFSLELGLEHALYTMTVPHPNTDLYKICQESGTILRDQMYFVKEACFLPSGYDDVKQLQALHAEAYRRFYIRPGYWWQCLGRIRSLDDMAYYARGAAALFSFLE